MPFLHGYQKVECRTIDGITIRGWFYSVEGRAPTFVMTPGVDILKTSMQSLTVHMADGSSSVGYSALIYDSRSIGDSDGLPRNHIDPLQQAEDLSDILTYVCTLPSVDASRIRLWGMSFGGTKSERRLSLKLIKDRQSQLRGNAAFTLPPFNSKGENPIVIDRGAPNYRNRITLQTYHKLVMWRPKELLRMVDVTPVMMITPELDKMSPPEEQKEAFERFQQPKKFYLAKAFDLSGDGSEEILEAQVEFMRTAVDGPMEH